MRFTVWRRGRALVPGSHRDDAQETQPKAGELDFQRWRYLLMLLVFRFCYISLSRRKRCFLFGAVQATMIICGLCQGEQFAGRDSRLQGLALARRWTCCRCYPQPLGSANQRCAINVMCWNRIEFLFAAGQRRR